MALRFMTAGESHGPALTVVVEGLPAGVPIRREVIERDLRRRMGGHGRGGRMKIETDEVEILGGVRFGRSLGSPISAVIRNRDHKNWTAAMSPDDDRPEDRVARRVTRPRPGHADLAGALKYDTHDARDILERASARETAARTAAGAMARLLLSELGIEVTSRTVAVGDAVAAEFDEAGFDALVALSDDEPMRCLDSGVAKSMVEVVDRMRRDGDSIGGVFEVLARGVPPGLGSHVHWDRKLDGLLAHAMMSIQAVKAVNIGDGVEGAVARGSRYHDPIAYDPRTRRFTRSGNRAGGIEGGVSNGQMIRVRGYLKPLATLPRPMISADLEDKSAFEATVERTDTIPIVAAGVVGEAMVSFVLAREALRKFGGDTVREIRRNLDGFLKQLDAY